jgi:hypothetical protein
MWQMGENRCSFVSDRSYGEGNNVYFAGTMNQCCRNDTEGLCDQQGLCPTDAQASYQQAHGHLAFTQMNQATDVQAIHACMQQRQQSLRPLGQSNNLSNAGAVLPRITNVPAEQCQLSTTRQPSAPHFIVTLPALLPGTRCYKDASIMPDSPFQVPRRAGLGVFFLNTHPNRSSAIYIKATLNDSTSVIMAEATALALAAQIAFSLGIIINCPIFLSDNQQLVTFLNGRDHTHPPHWNIKRFITQSFINQSSRNNGRFFKIHRKLNTTAHVLATRAFSSLRWTSTQMQTFCTNPLHVNSCPTSIALQSVIGDSITIIEAQCC